MPYPAVPGRRLAWHLADSGVAAVTYLTSDGIPVTATQGQRGMANNESGTAGNRWPGLNTGSGEQMAWALHFPTPVDLVGYFIQFNSGGSALTNNLQVSSNTTNGIDGTWNNVATIAHTASPNFADYRSNIVSASQSSISGIRLRASNLSASLSTHGLFRFHFYVAVDDSPREALDFIDPNTGDAFDLDRDYGDIPRNSAEDRTFIVRNLSATHVATDVTLGRGSLIGDSHTWYSFREAATTDPWETTLNIGTLGPEEDSPEIAIRRETPGNSTATLHAAYITADADWTPIGSS